MNKVLILIIVHLFTFFLVHGDCLENTPLQNVADGGTGACSLTAYAVLCGGTTITSPMQSVVSVGTSGQILTSNGANSVPTFQIPSVNTIVTTYNVGSGNHTLHVNTKALTIIGFGGGGGGGSGRAVPSSFFGSHGGGSAGGAGSVFCYTVPVEFFGGGGAVVPYLVGAGGVGGAALGAPLAMNGNPGTSGGYTSFGNLQTSRVISNLGLGGIDGCVAGGTNNILLGNLLSISSGTAGGAGNGSAAGSDAATMSIEVCMGTGGGGGGGAKRSNGITPQSFHGGAGGHIVSSGTSATLLAGGIAGVAGVSSGRNGGNGNNGALATHAFCGGTGGGGGAGNTSGSAGSGGNGGVPGGGGGGGGACSACADPARANKSGAGGNGGDGILYVIEYL